MSGWSLKADMDLGAAQLKAVTTYDELRTSSTVDRGPYLSVLDGTQHTFADVEGWSQEFRLSSSLGNNVDWQAGVYYLSWERLRTTAIGEDKGLGIKRPTTVPEFETSTNPTGTVPGNFLSFLEDSYAWAVFGSFDWRASDRFTLSLAMRYDEEEREQNVNPYNTAGRVYTQAYNGVNQPYAGTACSAVASNPMPNVNCGSYGTFGELLAHTRRASESNSKNFSKFQPKVTLKFEMTDNVNLYGSWGVGYRAGQYNYPGIDAISRSKDVIDQEENSTFEIGMKAEYNRFRFNAAWFSSTVENTQYFPFDGQAFVQVFEDVDEAELSGFEIEAAWKISESLDVYAAYGNTASEITAYEERPATIGNDLPYIADGTFNAGARVRLPTAGGGAFFARLDYELRGDQFWTPENAFPRDSLSLLNARLGAEGRQWTASLYVNNLTDVEYNSEVVTPLFLHPAPPRVWRLDYRYRF